MRVDEVVAVVLVPGEMDLLHALGRVSRSDSRADRIHG